MGRGFLDKPPSAIQLCLERLPPDVWFAKCSWYLLSLNQSIDASVLLRNSSIHGYKAGPTDSCKSSYCGLASLNSSYTALFSQAMQPNINNRGNQLSLITLQLYTEVLGKSYSIETIIINKLQLTLGGPWTHPSDEASSQQEGSHNLSCPWLRISSFSERVNWNLLELMWRHHLHAGLNRSGCRVFRTGWTSSTFICACRDPV